MQIPRSSGVLLHVSSLPGGRLGREAYRFVDWLVSAGQSWWALLPLGAAGLGAARPTPARPRSPPTPAISRSPKRASRPTSSRRSSRGSATGSPTGRPSPAHGAIADQVRFDREWSALRRYAAERGVKLFGDVPIYVARDGADEAAHPELFQHGLVAGAPPDGLSALGQLWGNPLYDWGAMRAQGYRWWIERLRRTFELYDAARVDHFRGFVAYWAVPEAKQDGEARPLGARPGRRALRRGRARARAARLVAEDLGVITKPVEDLRVKLGMPGMVVMQFAFDGPRVQPAPHPEPPAAERRLRRHARLRHRARLVAHAPEADQAGVRPPGRRAELGADRARALLARRRWRSCRRRTSSGSAARRG